MPNITQQLADTVTTVGVHAAYGDPIDLDGAKIVPVACAWYGFGGGEGPIDAGLDHESDGESLGSGGGGGGAAVPVGAYVTRDGRTRFEPNTIALLAVGIPFVWVAGRALARVIRALKR
jgi:uncharacterized spore protein YtfJ